jgi:glycosyltransferase involved in cell wall biosynthesis
MNNLISMLKPSVSVLIPCYNEEYNIQLLLLDVLRFARHSKFYIKEVLILDSSNDKTPFIIQKIAKSNPLIKHIRSKKRKNVNEAFNILIDLATADIIIWLNADIRFSVKDLDAIIDLLCKHTETAIVCPDMRPSKKSYSTTIGRALVFGTALTRELRKMGHWVLIGRAFAAKKSFLKFKLPPHLLDPDSFIFFKVRDLGGKILFHPDSCVYFTVPLSWRDFVIENGKFEEGQRQILKEFPYWYEYRLWARPSLPFVKAFVTTFVRDPFGGIIWITIKVLYKFLKPLLLNTANLLEPATTTKSVE